MPRSNAHTPVQAVTADSVGQRPSPVQPVTRPEVLLFDVRGSCSGSRNTFTPNISSAHENAIARREPSPMQVTTAHFEGHPLRGGRLVMQASHKSPLLSPDRGMPGKKPARLLCLLSGTISGNMTSNTALNVERIRFFLINLKAAEN
jgi:hypothetical protein